MNANNLYNLDDRNGEQLYFLDEACTMPYTGHIEEYYKGKLYMASDVVNGYKNGVYKEYYDDTHTLEIITGIKYNLIDGFHIEFFKSGRVSSISLWMNNIDFDAYTYSEEGRLLSIEIYSDDQKAQYRPKLDQNRILELRKKYKLEKINEEILRNGKYFSYEKYFLL